MTRADGFYWIDDDGAPEVAKWSQNADAYDGATGGWLVIGHDVPVSDDGTIVLGVVPPPAERPNDRIESMARLLCRRHFMRKKFVGACTLEERLTHDVNTYWHGWIADAVAVLALVDG